MGRRSRRALAVLVAASLVCLDAAWADEAGAPADPSQPAAAPHEATLDGPNPWLDIPTKIFDVVPIRLLSSSSVVIGFGAFVVSVPLVGPGFQMEGIRNSWDYFVMGPVEYTFVRPLGDF